MGCRKAIKDSWWNFCGETDMGQTLPVLCKGCGGDYDLMTEDELKERRKNNEKIKADQKQWEIDNPKEHAKHVESCKKLVRIPDFTKSGSKKSTWSIRDFDNNSTVVCTEEVVDGSVERTWYN